MAAAGPARRGAAYLALSAALILGACATVPGDLPQVRYAAAASKGEVSTFLAGRPSAEQVDLATDRWTDAVSDSFACGIPHGQVFQAGLIGALEVASMIGLGQEDDDRAKRDALRRTLPRFLSTAMVPSGEAPDGRRCAALRKWAPQVGRDGREALNRAWAQELLPRL